MEGIAIENLELGANRRPRALSPPLAREKQSRPREFDHDKLQLSTSGDSTPILNRSMQRDYVQAQPSSKKSALRVNIQTSSRSPDSETEKVSQYSHSLIFQNYFHCLFYIQILPD